MTDDSKPEIERVNGRWKDGRVPKVLCSAHRSNGDPCNRVPIKGSNVCSTHGGRAPAVRAAAQVRILMASNLAAAKLVELMSSPKVADNIKLAAAKDLLDRANLAGTQNIEIGVTPKKSFEDFVGEALIDVAEDDEADPDVIDAEIVEEYAAERAPLVPRDPDAVYDGNRHDRAVFAEVERGRGDEMRRMKRGAMSPAQRKAAEAEALASAPRSTRSTADPTVARAAYEAALENGATLAEAKEAGRAAAERATDTTGKRRARTSEATITTGSGRRQRRE